MADHASPPAAGTFRVDALMDDVRRRVREELRRDLQSRTSTPDFDDAAIFEAVETAFRGAIAQGRQDALLLPELLDGDDWQLETSLALSSHRPRLGRAILLVKRRLLLPLTHWLYDYSRMNFERQQRLNETVFACLQVLAADNARLRRDVEALQRGRKSGPADE